MRWYCGALMQFQIEYPFALIQVPREQNMMAGEPSDTDGDGLFGQQVDTLREGLGLEQFVDLSGVGCVCEEEA